MTELYVRYSALTFEARSLAPATSTAAAPSAAPTAASTATAAPAATATTASATARAVLTAAGGVRTVDRAATKISSAAGVTPGGAALGGLARRLGADLTLTRLTAAAEACSAAISFIGPVLTTAVPATTATFAEATAAAAKTSPAAPSETSSPASAPSATAPGDGENDDQKNQDSYDDPCPLRHREPPRLQRKRACFARLLPR